MSRSPWACAAFARRRAATAAAAVALLGACSNSTNSNPINQIPDFFYISNQEGNDEIYTFSKGVTTKWPATIAGDIDPQSAAGKVVFTSFRTDVSNAEIYIANTDGSGVTNISNNPAQDNTPALNPAATIVVWTRSVSGQQQIWSMTSTGANQAIVPTGHDPSFDNDFRPRYSPDGTQILFSSSRPGLAQVYVMPAAGVTSGDTATQITHEPNGAFDPAWSQDGQSIFYIDGLDRTRLHRISIASGTIVDYITGGTDLSEPACTATLCVVVSGANANQQGQILGYIGQQSTSPLTLVNVPNFNTHAPAFIH